MTHSQSSTSSTVSSSNTISWNWGHIFDSSYFHTFYHIFFFIKRFLNFEKIPNLANALKAAWAPGPGVLDSTPF